MELVACEMGLCSGKQREMYRPVHRHRVAFHGGGRAPATERRGLACSWWRVWRACARTEQGEVSVDDGRAAPSLHACVAVLCMACMAHAGMSSSGSCGHRLDAERGWE